jgi:hypothetical protein
MPQAPAPSVSSQTTVPPSRFPLSVGPTGRYLVDKSGVPYRIHCCQVWLSAAAFSTSDFELQCSALKLAGFTAMTLMFINHDYEVLTGRTNGNAPLSNSGIWPFTLNTTGAAYAGTGSNGSTFNKYADFSTANPSYFDTVITPAISIARDFGFLCFCFPAYMGYGGGLEGWAQDKTQSGSTKCNTYGQFIGGRYAQFPNIVWMAGGDYGYGAWGSTLTTCEEQMFAGMIAQGAGASAGQLIGGHWDGNATDVAAVSSYLGGLMTLNTSYAYAGEEYIYLYPQAAWAYTPTLPSVAYDPGDLYENQAGATRLTCRQDSWWGMLSAISGHSFGNNPLWYSDTGTWSSCISSTGIYSVGFADQSALAQFEQSIQWWKLIPSGTSGYLTLVTSGQGTSGGANWIQAAYDPAGSLLVAYCPSANSGSFTVNTSAFSGSFTAYWVDPTNCTYTTISTTSGSSLSVTKPGGNNAGGDTDWVLVIHP